MHTTILTKTINKKRDLTLNVPIPDKVKKIKINFYFNTAFRNGRVFKG